jgi:hypothetical protein
LHVRTLVRRASGAQRRRRWRDPAP